MATRTSFLATRRGNPRAAATRINLATDETTSEGTSKPKGGQRQTKNQALGGHEEPHEEIAPVAAPPALRHESCYAIFANEQVVAANYRHLRSAAAGTKLCADHWLPECTQCEDLPLAIEEYRYEARERIPAGVKRCIENRELGVYCCLHVDDVDRRLCGAMFKTAPALYAHLKSPKDCCALFERRQHTLGLRQAAKRAREEEPTTATEDAALNAPTLKKEAVPVKRSKHEEQAWQRTSPFAPRQSVGDATGEEKRRSQRGTIPDEVEAKGRLPREGGQVLRSENAYRQQLESKRKQQTREKRYGEENEKEAEAEEEEEEEDEGEEEDEYAREEEMLEDEDYQYEVEGDEDAENDEGDEYDPDQEEREQAEWDAGMEEDEIEQLVEPKSGRKKPVATSTSPSPRTASQATAPEAVATSTSTRKEAQPTDAFAWGNDFAGTYVCLEHFVRDCRTCEERTPVLVKYGMTYATTRRGRSYVCLYPRDTPAGEPCRATHDTQRELFAHLLSHDREEMACGELSAEVLEKRLRVSECVVGRLLERGMRSQRSAVRSRASALLAQLVREECQRLGYAPRCQPCAGVVLQRYNWARRKALMLATKPSAMRNDAPRLRWTLSVEIIDQLMREDTPLEDMTRDQVVSRIVCLWAATKPARQGYHFNRKAIVASILGHVQRTFSTSSPWAAPEGRLRSTGTKKKMGSPAADQFENQDDVECGDDKATELDTAAVPDVQQRAEEPHDAGERDTDDAVPRDATKPKRQRKTKQEVRAKGTTPYRASAAKDVRGTEEGDAQPPRPKTTGGPKAWSRSKPTTTPDQTLFDLRKRVLDTLVDLSALVFAEEKPTSTKPKK